MTNLSILLLTIFFSWASLLPISTLSFSPESPTDRRILVLLDDASLKSSHSIFFNSLQSRGFNLDFKLADDPTLSVQRYGQYLYDGLILFAPTTERFGGALDLAAVLNFVDSGHDLIVAADANASDLIRNIAAECGVDFDEDPSAMVIDHTSYAVSETEGDNTLLASDGLIDSEVILGKKKIEAPVLFRGIGHSLNPENNLVMKVLSASSTAYSANPTSELSKPPSLVGSVISLVSVLQARNNARVMISGSLDMFSNRLLRSGHGSGLGPLLASGATAAAAAYGAHHLSRGSHYPMHGDYYGHHHGKFNDAKFGKRWKHGMFGKHKFKKWK